MNYRKKPKKRHEAKTKPKFSGREEKSVKRPKREYRRKVNILRKERQNKG